MGRSGTDDILALAGGSSVSFQKLLESSAPGFSFFQNFFKTWLKLDLTTLALSLTVFGALSSGVEHLQGIAVHLYDWITRFFTASISISGKDRLNGEVLNWLGANILTRQQTRILTAQTENVYGDAYSYRKASQNRIELHEEKRVPIQYLPTFGTTWFFHERTLFLVRRVPDSRDGPYGNGAPDQYAMAPSGTEPLVVMCLGRSIKPVKRFLKTCRDFSDKQRKAFVTVRASRKQHFREGWDLTILRSMRPIDTVHFDKNVKDELVADIENYLKNSTRRFYMERGIPYRRGYLLHGPPGTGKTSLSLALAGHFGLELYLLHLPTIREDGDLEKLFVTLPPRCIVLIEDIDAVGLKRQLDKDDDDESLRMARQRSGDCTLSGLLNVLDGVASQEGRIVIMTSNFADKLDDALVRPGRIDRSIYLGNISKDAARLMYLRMYMPDHSPDAQTSAVEVDEDELAKFATAFGRAIPEDTFTPAKLQGFLLNYRTSPARATKDIAAWIEKEKALMAEAKAREKQAAERRAEKKAKATELGLQQLEKWRAQAALKELGDSSVLKSERDEAGSDDMAGKAPANPEIKDPVENKDKAETEASQVKRPGTTITADDAKEKASVAVPSQQDPDVTKEQA